MLSADAGGGGPLGGGLLVDTQEYDPTSVLVRFDPSYTDEMSPARWAMPEETKFRSAESLVSGLYHLELAESQSVEDALVTLRSQQHVLYVEPNYVVRATTLPNDPDFSDLWGLHNTGQTGGTVDADIDMTEAWDFATGSGDTVIAVIDTGVDYTHPDLAGNMWMNVGETAGDNIDNDGNGYVDDVYGYDFANDDGDPFDDHRHGTHVAGTIAAGGNNGLGVTGINWNAQIMAVKFLDARGSGTVADAIDAIDYAVTNGAVISNNSWGGNDGFSQALYDAIERARDADHVFVAAAGNGNSWGFGQNNDNNPFYPASFELDNIVAVAATDHNDARAIFSNYGAESVDLAAPGVRILSTMPNNSYGNLDGTSMAAPHVSGVLGLLRDVRPEWSYSLVIDHLLSTVDSIDAMQGRCVTGGRLNAATALSQAVDPAPEIQVLRADGTSVEDGITTVDFGTTAPGFPLLETFTVRNVGALPLTLDANIQVPADYLLVSGFSQTVLQSGDATTFALEMDASTEGTFGGSVSFGNDDSDENPFDFTVTGTVRIPPAIQILDDGEPGFDTVGEWNDWLGQGYQNDVHESLEGTGSDVASWTFAALPVGTYRVAATWSEYTNRATDAPYSIWDGATLLDTIRIDQQQAADDFNDSGAAWEELGDLYQVSSGQLIVRLDDDANGRVNADAIRIERLPDEPEIAVSVAGVPLADGSGAVDFGETELGLAVSRVFTVSNQGAEPLVLNEPISVPAGFEVVASFAETTLAVGQSTTFTLQLAAQEVGPASGTVSFANNDTDENPFDFTVSGTVIEPQPETWILDNGDAGFATVGEWQRWTGQGYENDIHESLPGSGADVASWTFEDVPAGVYQVRATWSAFSNRATNAPFSIWDGGTMVDVVRIDQQVAPDDYSQDGTSWENVGGSYQVSSGTLVVKLSDDADGRLNADAIRVEPAPSEPDIAVSHDGNDVADGTGSVAFGSTSVGVPAIETFTVTNAGLDTLDLLEPIAVPAGFELVSSFGSISLAVGESTTFAVQLSAQAEGNYSGAVSFGTNDPDENPFDFTVSGSVDPPPPPVQIIDNGDDGFIAVGDWDRWTGQGYENDIHESLAGTGSDVASWTFSGLPNGSYRVAATWSEYSNRATNAPFSVWDDDVLLATVEVNQQLNPEGFSDGATDWQFLGDLHDVQHGKLVVQLNDNADGRLNADAIRIERLPEDPDVAVSADDQDIPHETGSVDFGTTAEGVPLSKTFTVINLGQQALALVEPIGVPDGFSVATSFGDTILETGETTTFELQLDGAVAGEWSGLVSFASNDPDESPFQFTVSGVVQAAPPPVTLMDNGDDGFTTVGEWKRWAGQGFENDVHESLAGTGADIASWTFVGLPAANYQVAATWSAYSNRATNSPFSIWDGDQLLATVTVNQQVAADDFSDLGATWEELGGSYPVTSGTLVVQLADNANGRVNADAIRIERLASASMLDDSPTPGTGRAPSVGLLDAGRPGPRAERTGRLADSPAAETTGAAGAETVDRAMLELLEPLDRARPTRAERSDRPSRGDDAETVLDDELLDELVLGRI